MLCMWLVQHEGLRGHSLQNLFFCIWVEMFLCVSLWQLQAPCDGSNILIYCLFMIQVIFFQPLLSFLDNAHSRCSRASCFRTKASVWWSKHVRRYVNINIVLQPWTQSSSPASIEECCYCQITVNLQSLFFLWPAGTTTGLMGWIVL